MKFNVRSYIIGAGFALVGAYAGYRVVVKDLNEMYTDKSKQYLINEAKISDNELKKIGNQIKAQRKWYDAEESVLWQKAADSVKSSRLVQKAYFDGQQAALKTLKKIK